MMSLTGLAPFAASTCVALGVTGGLRSSLDVLGDVDGDGVADMVVASRDYKRPEIVWVISGRDGKRIAEVSGRRAGDGFGRSVSRAGDMDGDGFPDFLVGAHDDGLTHFGDKEVLIRTQQGNATGYVYVVSGRDGSVLRTLESGSHNDSFGYAVRGGADVNGDGVPDVLVGAPAEGRLPGDEMKGRVFLFSGSDGEVMQSFSGEGEYGSSVSFCADKDGDGASDILVGAPARIDATNLVLTADSMEPGFAEVRSSRSGDALVRLTIAGEMKRYFGWSVAAVGDMDGDGQDEFCVADIGNDDLYCFSGREGLLLRKLRTPKLNHVGLEGTTLVGIGDHDGDGVRDVLAAANTLFNQPGHARIYSGRDGGVLWEYRRPHPSSGADGGVDACYPGDLDGDSVADVVVALPGIGRLMAISGEANGGVLYQTDLTALRD